MKTLQTLVFLLCTGVVIGQSKMTKFNPEVHGFGFANSFQNHGFYSGAHMNMPGLCGGMSYAALDYYHAGIKVPQQKQRPKEGNTLTAFIRGRQYNSLANQADKWIEHKLNPFGWRNSEFWNWGVQGFKGGRLQELKEQIDRGKPVVLGLVSADGGSGDHQVIAYGYDMNGYTGNLKSNMDKLRIYVCDPNFPNKKRTLMPDSKNLRYTYVEDSGKKWLTYFVDKAYKPTRPLDPRVINKCVNTVFAFKDMSGKNLSKQQHRCSKGEAVKFRGATIVGGDFAYSDLSKGNFYGANCRNTNFTFCKLISADFYGADLKNCDFTSAKLTKVKFYGTDLKFAKLNNAVLDGGNLQGADLHQAEMHSASFKNAYMYKTSLNTAKAYSADFTGANLDGADLRGAQLEGANFKGAKITRNTLFDKGIESYVKNWPGVR